MLLGTFLRKRALTRGRPVGANGEGLRGGEEGTEDVDSARSDEFVMGAQSASEASASSTDGKLLMSFHR